VLVLVHHVHLVMHVWEESTGVTLWREHTSEELWLTHLLVMHMWVSEGAGGHSHSLVHA